MTPLWITSTYCAVDRETTTPDLHTCEVRFAADSVATKSRSLTTSLGIGAVDPDRVYHGRTSGKRVAPRHHRGTIHQLHDGGWRRPPARATVYDTGFRDLDEVGVHLLGVEIWNRDGEELFRGSQRIGHDVLAYLQQ